MTKIDLKKAEDNYFRGNLGAVYSPEKTLFRFWQPFAEKAFLRLYNTENVRILFEKMHRNKSVFELEVRGDLAGFEYDFAVFDNGEFREFADSYSRAVNQNATRGIVVDMRKNAPSGWETDKPIAAENPVIYELSVRDFSMDESADFTARGKFLAFCEYNVKNSHGEICGLEYIKNLGATHIQFMPVFDFDSDGSSYNWGYNPRFFNAPSNNYSQNNAVLELRKLVLSAHKKGLGVVADVVYNHVFDVGKSSFEQQIPGYFFRENGGFSNGSGCGNEFASERKMARKFILDSVEFLAREYHFDGFRFDLMGLLDIKTVREIERRLRRINPSILLYGEGWTGGESALSERFRAVQRNARRLTGIAFFNDSFRDAIRGNVFNIHERGFVSGAVERFEPIKRALSGKYPRDFWTENPVQTINYAECHDNHTLYDRLKISLKKAGARRFMRAEKMAAALILLSSGIAFLHAGQEFLRTKNGAENSYNLPDEINSIKWNKLSENSALSAYYRGLIAFRKRYLDELCGGDFSEINGGFLMKNEQFLLIINPTNKKITLNSDEKYEIFVDENFASDSAIYTKKRLCCAEYSVLLARRTTDEK